MFHFIEDSCQEVGRYPYSVIGTQDYDKRRLVNFNFFISIELIHLNQRIS